MKSNDENQEKKLSRNDKIKNLQAIGIEENEAISIVDASSRTFREKFFQYKPNLTPLMFLIAIGLAIYSLYVVHIHSLEIETIKTKIATLENQALFTPDERENVPTSTPIPTSAITPTITPTITLTSEPSQTPEPLLGKIISSSPLNVRSEPSESSVSLGKLPHGVLVQVMAQNDDGSWYFIFYRQENLKGWVNSKYVMAQGSWTGSNVPHIPMPIADLPLTPSATP
jgi:hypothetical protein